LHVSAVDLAILGSQFHQALCSSTSSESCFLAVTSRTLFRTRRASEAESAAAATMPVIEPSGMFELKSGIMAI
jgi:hypothetical protein